MSICSVAFGNKLSDKICNEYVNFDVAKPLNESMGKRLDYFDVVPSFNK